MRNASKFLVLLTLASLPLLAADEQRKAQKQINQVTAMAADQTGRRVVNQSLAEQLNIKKAELIRERREHNWNYGSLFLVHQLQTSGVEMKDIVDRLKAGKSLVEVADEFHADWKQIGNEAKKLNSKVEDNLYNFFINKKPANDSETTDPYDAVADNVFADGDVSKEDLEQAQQRYLFWRGRATAKKDGSLEMNKEQAARQTIDPVRKGGPQADQVGNIGPGANVTPH
jgi:hypothetical protein